MILQAAIDEDRSPKSVESFAQQEADKFKEALLETLKTMYGKGENETHRYPIAPVSLEHS
ncbi:hypothetical protein JT306_01875 [Salmonella enterica subsp. enterica serovar Kentucky]|nr:hypothetical protein [Salmonella enterica subsp. enterica serovar Kentucky]